MIPSIITLSTLVLGTLAVNQLSDDVFKLVWNDDYSASLTIDNHVTVQLMTPLISTNQLMFNISSQQMQCAAATMVNATDSFGSYTALKVVCTGAIQAVYSIKIYTPNTPNDGLIMFELELPDGLNPIETAALNLGTRSPPQFAPFPSFDVSPPHPVNNALTLCYGGDKAHMYTVAGGMASMTEDCAALDGGMLVLGWRNESSPTSINGLVMTAANEFQLNYPRIHTSSSVQATLFYNARRNDHVLCLSAQCNGDDVIETQIASGYLAHSYEGAVKTSNQQMVNLMFWWSPSNQDNWVTNSTASPGPGYDTAHAADGAIYANNAPGRQTVEQFWSDAAKDHMLVGSEEMKSYAKANGYVSQGILGYVDASPSSKGETQTLMSYGVSGELHSVPTGFTQQSMLYYSRNGLNAAVDGWGTALRTAYQTTKQEDADVFLQTLTIWTDNGAATLGLGWQNNATTPAYSGEGGFNTMDWTRADEAHMTAVAQDVSATGVAPRGVQFDCWWYPVNQTKHPFWCGVDWILPKEHYPTGMAGIRKNMGVPIMMYFPAVCNDGGIWKGLFNWTDTADQGWLLPVANETEAFFNMLFDYGIATATPDGPISDPWPNAWLPPAVKAGWKGINVAAYETDFFHNLEVGTPEYRQVYGAGFKLVEGIHKSAKQRNMTVQLCAGNVPDFLNALVLDTVTQARASIDYAWDTGSPTNNGEHNWAAPDNGWPFWGTRMGLSKDNFWTEYRDFGPEGYHPSHPPGNGRNAELHAVAAVLTGVVGIGDWVNMTNTTLVRRLARADGILLKPDRPMAPMDMMLGSVVGASHSLPGYATGSRAWMTHATVAPEDPSTAPELLTSPTRNFTSHTGRAATLYQRVPEALASLVDFDLSWTLVGVNATKGSWVRPGDLYPNPDTSRYELITRSYHGYACQPGTAILGSGCFQRLNESNPLELAHMPAPCDPATCYERLSVQTVHAIPKTAINHLLGDMNAYVPGSGYRFRMLQQPNTYVALGLPDETVTVAFITRSNEDWIFQTIEVKIDSTGRSEFALKQ